MRDWDTCITYLLRKSKTSRWSLEPGKARAITRHGSDQIAQVSCHRAPRTTMPRLGAALLLSPSVSLTLSTLLTPSRISYSRRHSRWRFYATFLATHDLQSSIATFFYQLNFYSSFQRLLATFFIESSKDRARIIFAWIFLHEYRRLNNIRVPLLCRNFGSPINFILLHFSSEIKRGISIDKTWNEDRKIRIVRSRSDFFVSSDKTNVSFERESNFRSRPLYIESVTSRAWKSHLGRVYTSAFRRVRAK